MHTLKLSVHPFRPMHASWRGVLRTGWLRRHPRRGSDLPCDLSAWVGAGSWGLEERAAQNEGRATARRLSHPLFPWKRADAVYLGSYAGADLYFLSALPGIGVRYAENRGAEQSLTDLTAQAAQLGVRSPYCVALGRACAMGLVEFLPHGWRSLSAPRQTVIGAA